MIQEVNAGNQYVSSKVALLRTRQWELNRRVLDLLRKIEVIRCHHTPLQESERRYDDTLCTRFHLRCLYKKRVFGTVVVSRNICASSFSRLI